MADMDDDFDAILETLENEEELQQHFVEAVDSSSHRFLYSAFRSAGSFQIPIPLLLLHVPQPNTEQFSPGIMSTVFINVFSYILKKAHCQAKHQCSWQIY
ncbi:uncharacterized protein LOC111335068 isoform X2 [Stylophora pistillata]|uniref:uncharacterized protein LOC111335068 isoform X2 n=1 Tax=Stylophora pistillata TaxID=50429 RepID=UPI000C04AA8A|nr:uncharacterized protein LOC111335068 isoform X2 [Stylophora pistillata]